MRLAKEIKSLEMNAINGGLQFFVERLVLLRGSGLDMADLDSSTKQKQGQDPILKHVGLVKRTALHLKARIPQVMDVDELIQVGMVGLIEASQNFDASRGVEFEIFAPNQNPRHPRRSPSDLGATTISNLSYSCEMNEATQELATSLGRTPTSGN